MPNKQFPQSKEYELSLLLTCGPEFKGLRKYLDAYLDLVLDEFELDSAAYQKLHNELEGDIPIAAERYLKSDARDKNYKFSAYFSWYVGERINKFSGLKRKHKEGTAAKRKKKG